MLFFQPIAKHPKLSLTVFFAALALVIATPLTDRFLNQRVFGKLDEIGIRYLDDTFRRSAYTYAAARGLNGVISVIQGTNVAIAPAGVGLNFAIGEILDPVNDLIERFSWIMLVSTVSLGIQKLLLEIGVWMGLRYLLSAALCLLAIGLWVPKDFAIDVRRIGVKLIALSVFLRLCFPISGLISEQIYQHFLAQQYEHSISSLESIRREVEQLQLMDSSKPDRKAEASVLGQLFELFSGSKDALSVKEKLTLLKNRIADYADYIIQLAIVFLLQTIILPLLVLWLFSRVVFYPYRLEGRS